MSSFTNWVEERPARHCAALALVCIAVMALVTG